MHPFLVLLTLPGFLGGCSDTGVTPFNANPDAEITSHSDSEEVLEGYTESFRGAVSDSAVSWAGDVNGDGYDNFIVGADLCDTSRPGRVYLQLSSNTCNIPPTAAEIAIDPETPSRAKTIWSASSTPNRPMPRATPSPTP
jgi:hypothetical protein